MRYLILTLAMGLSAACSSSSSTKKNSANPVVVLETSMGDIHIELNKAKAPISTKNILRYVDEKFYDGTVFHRVIKGFMVQGGGFTQDLQKKKVAATIKNEATNGLSNVRGSVAMARTGVVDSATSQFFINVVDNQRLDHKSTDPRGYGYAVIGKVVKGMDVVDKIREVPTCPRAGAKCTRPLPPGMGDVPAEPIVIKKAYVK